MRGRGPRCMGVWRKYALAQSETARQQQVQARLPAAVICERLNMAGFRDELCCSATAISTVHASKTRTAPPLVSQDAPVWSGARRKRRGRCTYTQRASVRFVHPQVFDRRGGACSRQAGVSRGDPAGATAELEMSSVSVMLSRQCSRWQSCAVLCWVLSCRCPPGEPCTARTDIRTNRRVHCAAAVQAGCAPPCAARLEALHHRRFVNLRAVWDDNLGRGVVCEQLPSVGGQFPAVGHTVGKLVLQQAGGGQ